MFLINRLTILLSYYVEDLNPNDTGSFMNLLCTSSSSSKNVYIRKSIRIVYSYNRKNIVAKIDTHTHTYVTYICANIARDMDAYLSWYQPGQIPTLVLNANDKIIMSWSHNGRVFRQLRKYDKKILIPRECMKERVNNNALSDTNLWQRDN